MAMSEKVSEEFFTGELSLWLKEKGFSSDIQEAFE